jgi:ELWxxDGT repeat protein
MVADINPGNLDSNPAGLIYANGAVFFSATDGNGSGSHGTELWKSDGTAPGTGMISDINPGQQDSNPAGLTAAGGAVYFSADDGSHGDELWKTDGSGLGTLMVRDINPGAGDSAPRFFNNYNGDLIFAADDGAHGYEPWKSDGTQAGTFLMQDINPGESSFPLNFGRLNPLFFLANDGHGFKLWKSDGTVAGTVKVSDVPTGSIVDSGGGSGGQPSDGSGGTPGQTAQVSGGNPGNNSGVDPGRSLLSHILGDASKETRLSEVIDKSPVPLYSPQEGTWEAATGAHPGVLKGTNSTGQADSGSPTLKWGALGLESAPGESGNGAAPWDAQDQDARLTKWDHPLPGMIKVVVLENGDYSVRTDVFALLVGAEVWTPPMVRWYLSALSEGRYRPGSLASGFERMIWDFLQFSAGRKTEGQAPLSDVESKLAWQWAEWRRQLSKARGNVEVLPWDYFKGLSQAMILFYGGGSAGDVDLAQAVNAMQQNVRNLSIIPIQLPDELLSKATEEPPGK